MLGSTPRFRHKLWRPLPLLPCCSLFPIVYCACRLRAVNVIKSVFYGLARHLSPCMLLKLRFFADSIPSALTT